MRKPETNAFQKIVFVVLLLTLVTAPLWAEGYLHILVLANIWSMFAMSWDILSGHTGYLSFGHSVIAGGAGYTTALVTTHIDPNMSMLVVILLSILVGVLVGLTFALPSLRLRGPYFALLTLVFALVAIQIVFLFGDTFGGELGLIAPIFEQDLVEIYYLTLASALVIAGGLYAINRSDIGIVFFGIALNEQGVEAAGIDTTKFKIFAFVLSAIPMSYGGVMLAYYFGNVDPNTFLALHVNIEIIAIAVLGGLGTIFGPFTAAYLFFSVRDIVLDGFGSTETNLILWGLVLVLYLRFPDGPLKIIWDELGDIEKQDVPVMRNISKYDIPIVRNIERSDIPLLGDKYD